jgi:hypothetical protein
VVYQCGVSPEEVQASTLLNSTAPSHGKQPSVAQVRGRTWSMMSKNKEGRVKLRRQHSHLQNDICSLLSVATSSLSCYLGRMDIAFAWFWLYGMWFSWYAWYFVMTLLMNLWWLSGINVIIFCYIYDQSLHAELWSKGISMTQGRGRINCLHIKLSPSGTSSPLSSVPVFFNQWHHNNHKIEVGIF